MRAYVCACVHLCVHKYMWSELSAVCSCLLIFCYGDLLLQLTCLIQLMVQHLHWMKPLKLTSMVRIVTCSTYILCTCYLFLQSFPGEGPSDVGVLGILEHICIPLWYDLAVMLWCGYPQHLGVPFGDCGTLERPSSC